MAYLSNGNDDLVPVRVQSQCALLRANINEFEKNKKVIGTTNNRFPEETILKVLDSTQSSVITTRKDSTTNDDDTQLKFYQTIVNELGFYQCAMSRQNLNAMQQD